MSAGKVTIVHCLSRLRRQAGRKVAAQVQYRGRGTASDQHSGARTHRHAAIQAYTQVAKQTHTKELKEKQRYLEMGWGTQPQQGRCTTLSGRFLEKQGTNTNNINAKISVNRKQNVSARRSSEV